MAILTSCDHSHLAWQFSPGMTIPTSHGNSHLTYILTSRASLHPSKSPHTDILTSRTHSHLAYIFSPCMPTPPFKVTSHTHSHLVYTFSPHVHILTSLAPSTTQSHLVPILSTYSHLAYIFSPCVLPSTQNNIFLLVWKNSQKSHAATPIPSIRYLLRATK